MNLTPPNHLNSSSGVWSIRFLMGGRDGKNTFRTHVVDSNLQDCPNVVRYNPPDRDLYEFPTHRTHTVFVTLWGILSFFIHNDLVHCHVLINGSENKAVYKL